MSATTKKKRAWKRALTATDLRVLHGRLDRIVNALETVDSRLSKRIDAHDRGTARLNGLVSKLETRCEQAHSRTENAEAQLKEVGDRSGVHAVTLHAVERCLAAMDKTHADHHARLQRLERSPLRKLLDLLRRKSAPACLLVAVCVMGGAA